MKTFYSMSGIPLNLTDEDRALCVICEIPYSRTTNLDGKEILGAEMAIKIRNALREEGLGIRRLCG